jgi:hypothetical protein
MFSGTFQTQQHSKTHAAPGWIGFSAIDATFVAGQSFDGLLIFGKHTCFHCRLFALFACLVLFFLIYEGFFLMKVRKRKREKKEERRKKEEKRVLTVNGLSSVRNEHRRLPHSVTRTEQ